MQAVYVISYLVGALKTNSRKKNRLTSTLLFQFGEIYADKNLLRKIFAENRSWKIEREIVRLSFVDNSRKICIA